MLEAVDTEEAANAGRRKAIVLLTDDEDNPCGLYDATCSTNGVGSVRDVACTAAKAVRDRDLRHRGDASRQCAGKPRHCVTRVLERSR